MAVAVAVTVLIGSMLIVAAMARTRHPAMGMPVLLAMLLVPTTMTVTMTVVLFEVEVGHRPTPGFVMREQRRSGDDSAVLAAVEAPHVLDLDCRVPETHPLTHFHCFRLANIQSAQENRLYKVASTT